MYYETAEVKKYTTKNKKTGIERTTFQIHIKKGSKYRIAKPIGLIEIDELKKIETYLKHNPIEEKEAEINELNEEIVQLKQQLQESKATIESLTSEVNNLKEEKIQLQEDLLNVEDKSEEIIQLQKDHKEEVAELNFKLNNEKDLNKELLVVRSDFLKQNPLKRLFKVEPESSKRIAKLKELPENEVPVEAKNSKD